MRVESGEMKSLKLFGREVFAYGEPEDSKIKGRTVKAANMTASSGYHVGDVNKEMLRRIALREPLILKAIYKKNKDTIRNWFTIQPIEEKKLDTDVPDKVLRLIYDFNRRTMIQNKLYVAGCAANIYGTGFLELTYVENKNKKCDSPVDKSAIPLGVNLIDSEKIDGMKNHPDKPKDETLYYEYKVGVGTNKYIHPDRIIPIVIDKLPFSHFGISKVEVALNVLKSKMNADVSSGEILAWFSHGIIDWTIEHMDDEQEKQMLELCGKHLDYFAHDETYKLDVKNPTQIEPKSFYDYFYNNIAAAVEIPTHMLIGKELGNVTGSEVGLSDYYHDVENIQRIVFTPILEYIYKKLVENSGYVWDYKIVWNPIFVDEQSEAKILQIRTYSATQNYANGIIDESEARKILNNGVIILDVDKPMKPKEVPDDTIDQPNVEPQPPKKPTIKNKMYFRKLTPSEQRMIEAQKKLGEEVLKEQERLFGAENEKKKQESKGNTRLEKKKKGSKKTKKK